MVDFGLLLVAQRRLVGRLGGVLGRQFKDGLLERSSSAKGAEHDVGLEFVGGEEGRGNVFVGL